MYLAHCNSYYYLPCCHSKAYNLFYCLLLCIQVPLESLLSVSAPPTPLKGQANLSSPLKPPHRTPPTPPPPATPPTQASPFLENKPSSSFPHLRAEIRNHPDVILPSKTGLRSGLCTRHYDTQYCHTVGHKS